MTPELPRLFLARHGDTAWTDSRRHTGRTDIPLNELGEERARQIGEHLRRFSFTRALTSPLQRASKTCELAGFGAVASSDPDLVEWDYGRFEGMLTKDILKERPGWELFRDGCPEGESPEDVAARADDFIARVQRIEGDALAFSSGHIIRMIAARWLGLPPDAGRFFYCRPASVGVLGFEHNNRDEPVIRLWNYVAQPREKANQPRSCQPVQGRPVPGSGRHGGSRSS
jgi:broad specificity phosphatase PhoE